jgi:AcrR family transcriptional regulator
MEPNRQSAETRQKILEAASRLFADNGYRGTTIEMIVRAAGVNIAAVNYHFGGKESLYQQTWRHAHDQLMAAVPPHGGVAADEPVAKRLRGWIQAGLRRAMLGDAIELKIMRNEMANPTGLLRQVIDDAIRPIRNATQALLRELLGPRASRLDIELCEVCLIAPLMHVAHHRQAQKHEGLAPVLHEEMLDVMTEHFTAYALAGIRQIRRRLAKSGSRRRRAKGRPA